MKNICRNIFVFLLISLCSFNGVSADQVSCEKIESYGWSWGTWRKCFMDKTIEINSAETTIASRDESIQGLWFSSNKKIKFLPIKISEEFSNLLELHAGSCSLTTISKANFKNLSKLKTLYLNHNQIEKITSDGFEDLVALEALWLHDSKLKFINGKTFARLTKLRHVYLGNNQCINEGFDFESRIAVLQQTVNQKCSFVEELKETSFKTSTMTTTTASSLADMKCEKSQDLVTFTTTIDGMKAEISKVIIKLNEQKEECGNIAKAFEAQAKAFKDQQTYFNKALENKTAEIVDVKVKLAQEEMQKILKMTEIQRLEEDVQRKDQKIIEKNEKIKKLEEKVEALSSNFK